MMRKRTDKHMVFWSIGLIFIVLGLFQPVLAQDIHFTQFDRSKIQLNPALTGNFQGDFRLNGNYRSQWKSVTRPYNTFQFAADANSILIEGLGVGIAFMQDAAGDGNLTTSELSVPLSYRVNINAQNGSQRTLTLGVQPTFGSVSLDWESLTFDDQFNGWNFDPSSPTQETPIATSFNYFSASLGLVFAQYKTRHDHWIIGYSVHQINQPKWSIYGASDVKVPKRNSAFITYNTSITEEWKIETGIRFQQQNKHSEWLLGANGVYVLDERYFNYRAIVAGAWVRAEDAGALFFGFDYNNWRTGLSYDFNWSELTTSSNYRGGIEFSVIYILFNQKGKDLGLPKKYCPDYL